MAFLLLAVINEKLDKASYQHYYTRCGWQYIRIIHYAGNRWLVQNNQQACMATAQLGFWPGVDSPLHNDGSITLFNLEQ